MKDRHSLFFPVLLIAAGVLWLLINFGYIGAANLWALAHVWPLLLIGAGLGLILRSYWSEAGITISALMVIGLVAAVIYAPQLGWAQAPSWAWNWDWNVSGGISGSGNLVTETRDLGQFSSIDIQYPSDVVVRLGDSETIAITADDNLMPQLVTQVSGDRLVIRTEERNWAQRVNASETVQIIVTLTDLQKVDFNSAGSLVVESLAADQLEFSLNGAGSVTLNGVTAEEVAFRLDGAGSATLIGVDLGKLTLRLDGAGSVDATGNVDELDVRIDGLGSMNAEGLTAQTATVNVNGLGSATLRVELELTVNIDGLGSVNYYGSPNVHQETDGLGSVNRAGD
ncbi:MAG: head GIN domain-containing protein [Anaerolineales bacterium]